ncbi:MAG: 16S rRNA (adenine(1518)-N(6)/adenine(1519)-N(6))-dimethyltransferase RsmA [Ammonifex sp.]|nr:MAG: 16S rRNA (adenine(1518)-N(6)/adenine(1519)-N(6))-dimethyltransferase RsmA [Ammonifex sp.]
MERSLIPAAARAYLTAQGFKPKKRLGQHFLVNPGIINKIVAVANLTAADTVLEIGPGVGTLTLRLAEDAGKVVAVEVDRVLAALLGGLFSAHPHVVVVEGDALKVDPDYLVTSAGGALPYKVVANLPYYITTPLLTRFLEGDFKVSVLVLMVQKEVALRLVARPGTKEYGSLSVLVAYKTEPELVTVVSRGSFSPVPAVDSAVVRLAVRTKPPVAVVNERLFFRVVRAAFGQRRKTLLNALAGANLGVSRDAWKSILTEAGIDPERRGETLSLEEFALITGSLAGMSGYV